MPKVTSRATLPTAATGGSSAVPVKRSGATRPSADRLGPDISTAAPPITRPTPGVAWVIATVAGIVALFAGFVVWSVHTGAVHRAYSDDWGYLRIARRFIDDGHLDSVGWNDTSLVGQLLVSKLISPLTGSSIAGLRVLSILCGAGSLVLTAVLARHAKGRVLWPVVPLTLLVALGFGSTLTTYMTEQPAVMAQLGALALGFYAWRRWDRTGRLPLVALMALGLVGVWGGSIRQAAVAASLAALTALLTHPQAGRSDRRLIALVGAAVLVSVLVFMAATPLGGPTMAIVRGSLTGQVARIYQAAATLALFLTPVAILTGWFGGTWRIVVRWWKARSGRLALGAVGAVVIAGGLLLHRRDGSLVVGNSLQEAGGYQGTDIAFPSLFDPLTWSLLQFLAGAALFLLAVLVLDSLRHLLGVIRDEGRAGLTGRLRATTPLTRLVGIWTVLSILGVLAVNVAYRAIYDRYLITILIGLALLAVDNRVTTTMSPARRTRWAVVAFLPVLALAVVSATDTQDLLELRWAGADRLVQLGYAPDTVDAGFDWVGYHYPGMARPDNIVVHPDDYPPATYDVYFPGFAAKRCALVTGQNHAPPGYVLLDRVEQRRLFGLRTTTAYLYGNSEDGKATCPPITRR